jgi:glutamine cyclotransferase
MTAAAGSVLLLPLLLLLLLLLAPLCFASLSVLNRIAYAQPRCIQGFAAIDATRFVVSEGYWGLSRLLHVDIASGAVLKSQDIAREIFAEGIAFTPAGELWMLTYTNNRVLRFDLESLQPRADAPTMLAGQGWGLAYDGGVGGAGAHFIVTNGSNLLSFRDPVAFVETKLVPVTHPNGTRVTQLNELELVRVGSRTVLLANVWFAEIIVGIDPSLVLFCSPKIRARSTWRQRRFRPTASCAEPKPPTALRGTRPRIVCGCLASIGETL